MRAYTIARFIEPSTIATNATGTGKAVDCRSMENLQVVIQAVETSTPVGTLKLQGSNNYDVKGQVAADIEWFDVELPDGSLDGSGYTDPAADIVGVAWDGTAELTMAINILWPYKHMRFVWTRSGGGSAAVFFKAHAMGRG